MITYFIYTLDSVIPCCDNQQVMEEIQILEEQGEPYEIHSI